MIEPIVAMVKAAISTVVLGAIVVLAIAHASPSGRGAVRGTVQVTRAAGIPAGPVLVYVVGFTEPAPDAQVTISQIKKQFVPDLVAVTAGQTVAFPNKDSILHNVFSPTAERAFDLGSFAKDATRTRTFPSAGVIEVYCNIHPEMSATIVVLPNHRFTLADANGKFELPDLPVGTWQVFAYSRRALHPAKASVTIVAGETAEVSLALDEEKHDFAHSNTYGEKYRDDSNIYNP